MSHHHFMQRCIQLALKGQGAVSPNPMVGSVVVHDNKIIGEGWHQKVGEAHAEVNAIDSVQNKDLLKQASLYVNLEPCSHYGRTPPCADLILKHKIPKVIIGSTDTYSEVNGKGIERLKQAGVDVIVGVLEEECLYLNRRFFSFHHKKRPYIILKWAQTLDGFIDKQRNKSEVGQNWISGKQAKIVVHKWRSEEDAILVGAQTVINDNPSLTTRELSGRNPLRILIDPNSRISLDSKVYDANATTFTLTKKLREDIEPDKQWLLDSTGELIPQLMTFCYKKEIQSIIVEGGRKTLEHFIHNGTWDEARVFIGAKSFGQGLKAPNLSFKNGESTTIGNDKLHLIRNK